MAYSRKNVEDLVTIMDKELYDNLQDGIDEAKESIEKLKSDGSNVVLKATVED